MGFGLAVAGEDVGTGGVLGGRAGEVGDWVLLHGSPLLLHILLVLLKLLELFHGALIWQDRRFFTTAAVTHYWALGVVLAR